MTFDRLNNLAKPKILAASILLAALAACAPGAQLEDVRGKPVPTATFLFFDKDSAELQSDSVPALRQAAAFLIQYDNTYARIVGHVAPDEAVNLPVDQRIDAQRSTVVGTQLMQLGVQAERLQPFSAGQAENMSQPSGDSNIDRRVDIIFAVR